MPKPNTVKPLLLLLIPLLILFITSFSAPSYAGGVTADSVEKSETNADVYGSLAALIEDPKARDKLVEELKSLSNNGQTNTAANTDEQNDNKISSKNSEGVAASIAEKSQVVVESMITTLQGSWEALSSLWQGSGKSTSEWLADLIKTSLVVAATVIGFILLRLVAKLLFTKTSRFVNGEHDKHPLVIKTTAVIMATIIDIAVVALAWLAGYGSALLLVGKVGEINVAETLFLNIFLAVEFTKVIIRAIFSGRNETLRLVPMSTENARQWSGFLSRIISLIGYGTLFLVPYIALSISDSLSELANLFIVLFTVIYALVVIFKTKNDVKEHMLAAAEQSHFSVNNVMLRVLARTWHWFAIVYFLALGSALLVNSDQALPIILLATVKTVIVTLVGMAVVALLDVAANHNISLPPVLNQHLSNAETRFNQQLPRVFKILKIVVLLLVVSSILDAWHVINLLEWMESPFGQHVLTSAISVFLIISTSMMIWIVLASWIEHRLNPEETGHMPSAREKTLLTIFRNAIAITIIIMTTMIVLSEIGINIGPLIAGAGVLGLAIGFGAQKLVQDVITGVFIQLENAINNGDVVTADGITGVAEKLTIRSLGLRDLSGTFHIIPFSSVTTVSNYMREFAYHVGEYGVAYREDIDQVIAKLREAFAELMSEEDFRSQILVDELEVHGVTALADSSVNIRVRIKTLPGSQWGIGRAYNRLVKYHLDAAGIEIPFPHLTLYFGEDKEGKAPAAPLRMVDEVEVKELFNAQSRDEETDSSSPSSDKSTSATKADTNPSRKGDFDDAD